MKKAQSSEIIPPLKLSLKLSSLKINNNEGAGVSFSAPPHPPPSTTTPNTRSIGDNIPKLKLSLKAPFSDPIQNASANNEPQALLQIPKITLKKELFMQADPPLDQPVDRSESPSNVSQNSPQINPLTLLSKKRKKINFYDLCSKLLQLINTKDVYGFFGEPVDTSVVTDYLDVISEPMDLSNMQAKIYQKTYQTLSDFERDFELIVSNAKSYNPPNSIYYKAAERFCNFGRKLISKESAKIADGVYELVWSDVLAAEQKELPIFSKKKSFSTHNTKEKARKALERSSHSLRLRDPSRVSYVEDEPDDEEWYEQESDLDEQLDNSDKETYGEDDQMCEFVDIDGERSFGSTTDAAHSTVYLYSRKGTKPVCLFKKTPDGSFVFSSAANIEYPTGSTTADGLVEPSFFADGSAAVENFDVRQLLLTEYLVDNSGTSAIPTLGEILHNPAITVPPLNSHQENSHISADANGSIILPSVLNYGPFVNSFGPSIDSSKATLTPSESMLISLMYSDTQGKAFVESMTAFARETGSDFLIRYVDGLTSVLTKDTPSVMGINPQEHSSNPNIAANCLERSLLGDSNEGIDFGLVDAMPEFGDIRENCLYRNSRLLLQLIRRQNQRLSMHNLTVSEDETSLAKKIRSGLFDLCNQVQPKELISEMAVYQLYQAMQQQHFQSQNPHYSGTLSSQQHHHYQQQQQQQQQQPVMQPFPATL